MVSPCGLGFLTTWRLGSKGKLSQRQRKAGGSHIASYITCSLPPDSVSQGKYKDLFVFKGKEHRLPPLSGRTAVSYCKKIQVGWDIECHGRLQKTEDEISHRKVMCPALFLLIRLLRELIIQWS